MSDARLQVTDASGRRIIVLDKDLFSIGRKVGKDLQIVEGEVSRDHAEIVRRDGVLVLRDQRSRYGTFVNGDSVTERTLAHGDRIRFGRSNFVELVFLSSDADPGTLVTESGSGPVDLKQIAALLDGLRALGSGRVIDEVLTLVIDSALEVTGAERGLIMLANPSGTLEFKLARAKGQLAPPDLPFATSRKIPDEVFRSGRARIVADLGDHVEPGDSHSKTMALGIRRVLCAPLRVMHQRGAQAPESEPGTIGVLYLDGRVVGPRLSTFTATALEAFATEAALAIESARLYSESAEKARLDNDLRVAADIQRALLPEPNYAARYFMAAAVSVPCRTIGGDFYDYMELSSGRFAFALGDVAGKGPPAALLAAAVQSLLAAHTSDTTDPAECLTRMNQGLLRRAIQGRFATMFYGLLSPDGTLTYSSAGHEPPCLVGRSGVRSLEAGGLVLGLFSHATYPAETVALEHGDVLVVCSDGVTEARNPRDEEFGRDRLVACINDSHGADPQALLDRIVRTVYEFAEGAAQADDLTALVLRYGSQH